MTAWLSSLALMCPFFQIEPLLGEIADESAGEAVTCTGGVEDFF